ncbi:MAG: hypothetical protein V3T56_09630 [Gemmatimonadales bacterium]
MSTQDPVGLALASIGAGSTTGASIMTAGVFALRFMQASGNASTEVGGSILSATLFGGIVAAILAAWIATAPIADGWRRGVTAGISVLGAALLAIGATMADQVTGVIGVGAYGVVLVVAAVVAHRAARRLGRA